MNAQRIAWMGIVLLSVLVSAGQAWTTQTNWVTPGAAWDVQAPETVGIKSGQLAAMAAHVGGSGVIIKDGHLVYSWGSGPNTVVDWMSASKPVLSTLLFMAINEGKVASVDKLIDDYPWVMSAKDQTMTFRHLADMTSGYALPENPGTTFSYNDYAIDLYAKTLDVYTFPGEDANAGLIDEGTSRLKTPLQFQDGVIFGNSNVNRPGLRVKCSPRDFARIGWMWMQKGQWGANTMIPASFFDNYCKADIPSTTPISTTYTANDYLNVSSYGGGTNQADEGPGIYGFNWWHNTSYEGTGPLTWPSVPADAFQANGGWGLDVMTMIPSMGLVAAGASGAWGEIYRGVAGSGMDLSLGMLVAAAMHPGDANGDNAVNVGDLGILAANWNGPNKFWNVGDFNMDGTVNVGDLGVLAANWNWTSAPGSSGSIPEPASLILLCAGAAGLIRRRGRA